MKRLSVTFGCDTPLFLVGQKIKCSQQQHVWNRIPYTVLSHQLSNSAFFKKSMSVSATFACKFSLLASQPKRFAKYIMQQAVCGDDATLQQAVIFFNITKYCGSFFRRKSPPLKRIYLKIRILYTQADRRYPTVPIRSRIGPDLLCDRDFLRRIYREQTAS